MASSLFRLTRLTAVRGQTLTNFNNGFFGIGLKSCRYLLKSDVQIERVRVTDDAFNDALRKTNNVQSLLKLAVKQSISITQATDIISMLGKLASRSSVTPETIFNDESFEDLSGVINKNIRSVNHTTLISTLQNLLNLGIPPDKFIVQTVENEVLWRIRKMSLKNLVYLLSFHSAYQHTDLQRRVVNEVLDKIYQRWFEISLPQEIISLLKLTSYFRADFIGKLEDRIMELADKMPVEELQKIFTTLAEQKLRPTHLMRSLAFHIAKCQQKMSVKQMSNVIYAMSALSFNDSVLLQRISEDVLSEIGNITKSSLIASFLTGFGRLQWRDTPIMEAITEWIRKNLKECRPQDLTTYILTAARINFIPEERDAFFSSLIAQIPKESIAAKTVWLDFVWSLAILQCASSDQLSSVLIPSFYQDLIELPSYQGDNVKKKLLNINAVAKYEISNYKGAKLEERLFEDSFPEINAGAIRLSVVDTLSNSIPKGKFLACGKMLPSGISIDAEFVIGKDGRPLPCEEYIASRGQHSIKLLPEGAKRVALLVHEFKDFTHHDVKLVGHKSLSVRILKKLRYSVMQIPYTEYSINAPTLKRLQYLQSKMNESLGKADESKI